MRHENEYILACCKYLQPDHGRLEELHGEGLDYIYILGQLLYNRVGGAAWQTLEKSPLESKLNREFKNALKAIHETNKTKGEGFKKSLELLAGVLSGADFPYALLKGSYLAGLYPPGVRT
ncbi:MAG: nucleotidyltransferase family protein, partial [Oscillospiraceae bacterium]|nr:nucleotidyltransferase family protein [Oscillospiraceae bacterium]